MEEEAQKYFDRIEGMGGMVAAIEKGFPQREIQEASFRYQSEVDGGQRKVVAVNYARAAEPAKVPPLRIPESARDAQIRRIRRLRKSRDPSKWERSIANLKDVARSEQGNTMEPILAALRAKATLGEIVQALEEVYGRYRETSMF